MNNFDNFFKKTKKAKIAIFLSGNGTNALKILEGWYSNKAKCPYEPICLVTDRDCAAEILAKEFSLPLVKNDIFNFYQSHKINSISIANEKGRKVRQLWTESLKKSIKDYSIDFGVFAGFIPLCNITEQFPCLNIHPGDLTYLKNNNRILVGLHTLPVYKAIQEGLNYLKSTVILADSYSKSGKGMDEGIILGTSEAIPIDFMGKDLYYYQQKELKDIKDFLQHNLNRLKEKGDWIVFPKLIQDFAKQKFLTNKKKELYFEFNNSKFVKIEYIIYNKSSKEIIFNES